MAEYVDAVTYVKTNLGDKTFMEELKGRLDCVEKNNTTNVTGLGNLAYVAIYARDMDLRNKAALAYTQYLQGYTASRQSGCSIQ